MPQLAKQNDINELKTEFLPFQFIRLVKQIQQQKCFPQIFVDAQDFFHLKNFKLEKITPQKMVESFQGIQEKKQKTYTNNYVSKKWKDNELKMFVWLIIAYTFLKKKNVFEMEDYQWKIFAEIFNEKGTTFLQYEAKILYKKCPKFKKWLKGEDNFIQAIVSNQIAQQKTNWKKIGYQLYEKSNKQYLRSPKQIRQYWINHLDPTKSKNAWTIAQDLNLCISIQQDGKKWSHISKILKNRTEHMVKNRYIYLIKKNSTKSCKDEMKIMSELIEEYKNKLSLDENNVNNTNHENSQMKQKQIQSNQAVQNNQEFDRLELKKYWFSSEQILKRQISLFLQDDLYY